MARTRATGSTPGTETLPRVKRLNVNLPGDVYDELQRLAEESSRTMTDLVRMAFGLVKVAIEASRQGKSLYIGKDGRVERELIIMP